MCKKHVFIPYCHDNKEEVAQLSEDLENAGEPVLLAGFSGLVRRQSTDHD